MDGFDLALRAVLGQQVSVKGATTLAGRFAEQFGDAVQTPDARLRLGVPQAARVAGASIAELRALGVAGSRAESIQALARVVANGALRIEAGADAKVVMSQLTALPALGSGPRSMSLCAHCVGRWISRVGFVVTKSGG